MTTTDSARVGEANFDRRQLLKIGAWAAPVVLIAASVPSAAASLVTGTVTVPPVGGITVTQLADGTFLITVDGTADLATNEEIQVTAVILITPQDGEWIDGVPAKDAKKDGEESRTDVETLVGPGALHFEFPPFKKHKTDKAYTYTITVSWGASNQFSRTGTF